MMKPDVIPDVLAPAQRASIVFAEDISHLRNYLPFSQPEASGALSSLSSLANALGMTEEELAGMCGNASGSKS